MYKVMNSWNNISFVIRRSVQYVGEENMEWKSTGMDQQGAWRKRSRMRLITISSLTITMMVMIVSLSQTMFHPKMLTRFCYNSQDPTRVTVSFFSFKKSYFKQLFTLKYFDWNLLCELSWVSKFREKWEREREMIFRR